MTGAGEAAIAALAAEVRAGNVPASAFAEASLARIARLDPGLHAFTQVFDVTQAFEAGAADRTGPLAGVPIAVKDNIDVEGRVTTLGRPAGERPPAARDADAVSALRRAGAVVLGKTNLPEFASSAVTVNAHYGDARNPWDTRRTAGGSSGGSAVAVAARMVPAALGTDTGGSVLIPAALTGICGFRPTHGRIGLGGVVPLAPSLDTVGVLAAGPADLSALAGVLLGPPPPGPAGRTGLAGLRAGVLAGEFLETEDGVRERVEAAVRDLEAAGVVTRPVELPSAARARRHGRAVYRAEAAEVLRRLLDPERTYAPEVEARRAASPHPAGLDEARAFRREWRAELAAAFADADVLVAPTVPTTAPLLDSATEEATRALVRHTYPFCFAGAPALSLPAGSHAGLPVGLMLVAPPGADHRLLAIGAACHDAGLSASAPPLP